MVAEIESIEYSWNYQREDIDEKVHRFIVAQCDKCQNNDSDIYYVEADEHVHELCPDCIRNEIAEELYAEDVYKCCMCGKEADYKLDDEFVCNNCFNKFIRQNYDTVRY